MKFLKGGLLLITLLTGCGKAITAPVGCSIAVHVGKQGQGATVTESYPDTSAVCRHQRGEP